MYSTTVSLLVLAFCLGCLLIQESWATAKKSRSLSDVLSGNGHALVLLFKLFLGTLVFVAAFVCCKKEEEVFSFRWNENWRGIIPLFVGSALITGFLMAGKHKINPITQSKSLFGFGYTFLRIIHITFYEIFFRGILLFLLIEKFGVITAVWLNIIFYALLHFHCEYSEMIGTIPFGLLLCVLTITYHSIWPAVVIHLALALSHECMLIHHSNSSTKFLKL